MIQAKEFIDEFNLAEDGRSIELGKSAVDKLNEFLMDENIEIVETKYNSHTLTVSTNSFSQTFRSSSILLMYKVID